MSTLRNRVALAVMDLTVRNRTPRQIADAVIELVREEAARIAETPILPCHTGGHLILDKHTSVTIAAAIRSMEAGQ